MLVHLATLAAIPDPGPGTLALVAPARRAKALALKRPRDRQRSLLAGLMLREVLGVSRDEDLEYGPQGRPSLAGGGPSFSLSHSGPYVALSVGRPVHGIDLQETRTRPVPDSLARWALAPEELAEFGQNPDPCLFTRIWTMKEAFVKATGLGLSQGLDSFSVLPWGPGPRVVAGTEVHFFLLDLPGAAVSLASLAPCHPPLAVDLAPRLSRLAMGPPGLEAAGSQIGDAT
ncbi:MAG: 4'-phosphopantetheinyl transferase superfamily protein [Deltaproteobacteria bacterium]|nr:4'-phosphopantetheinyl transferase superfamily protein [Deltaproteobacteria bacterium]